MEQNFWKKPANAKVRYADFKPSYKREQWTLNPFIRPSRIYLKDGWCFEARQIRFRKVLPNFLIIGSGKSGTTSLHYYLGHHPDIFMPALKEPGLFLNYDERRLVGWMSNSEVKMGLSNNQLLRTLLNGYRGQRWFGESSPHYTSSPYQGTEVPENVKFLCPHMKFVYLIRNPFKKILSQYLHFKRPTFYFNGRRYDPLTTDPFDRHFEKNKDFYISLCLFHYQLSRYLAYFPKGQFKILLFEDFVRDPMAALREIFSFLNVSESKFPGNVDFKIYNKTPDTADPADKVIQFLPEHYASVMDAVRPDLKRLRDDFGINTDRWDFSQLKWCCGTNQGEGALPTSEIVNGK